MSSGSGVPFGDQLRRKRRDIGLSQEELPERAGLSVRVISDLDRAVIRAPRRDTLVLLADALGLSAEERAIWERTRKRLASRVSPAPARGTAGTAPVSHVSAPPTTFIDREQEVAEDAGLPRRQDV